MWEFFNDSGSTYDDEWLTATGAAWTVCATATGCATTAGACETITPGAALATAKTQAIANYKIKDAKLYKHH